MPGEIRDIRCGSGGIERLLQVQIYVLAVCKRSSLRISGGEAEGRQQRIMIPEYTNVPCGGICDEIEEWAALEDDDDSVEYPCEGCIYEFYLTGAP
jgi:hypothetical protein